MATFGWTEDYVIDELDGAKGNVRFNWARANQASVWGTGVSIEGKGYIQRELDKLKQQKRR